MNTVRSVVKSRLSRNVKDRARNHAIDLALAVMCAIQRPGECVPLHTIAEITGMSHGAPYWIEQNALKKIRKQLFYLGHRGTGQEIKGGHY